MAEREQQNEEMVQGHLHDVCRIHADDVFDDGVKGDDE